MTDYATTAAVAAELMVSEETVRAYVRDGVIPVLDRTPGGHARYDVAAVRAAIDLQPRMRRLRPLKDRDIRLGDRSRRLVRGSLADDLRIGAGEPAASPAPTLPTWPGRPGSATVIGGRPLDEA